MFVLLVFHLQETIHMLSQPPDFFASRLQLVSKPRVRWFRTLDRAFTLPAATGYRRLAVYQPRRAWLIRDALRDYLPLRMWRVRASPR